MTYELHIISNNVIDKHEVHYKFRRFISINQCSLIRSDTGMPSLFRASTKHKPKLHPTQSQCVRESWLNLNPISIFARDSSMWTKDVFTKITQSGHCCFGWDGCTWLASRNASLLEDIILHRILGEPTQNIDVCIKHERRTHEPCMSPQQYIYIVVKQTAYSCTYYNQPQCLGDNNYNTCEKRHHYHGLKYANRFKKYVVNTCEDIPVHIYIYTHTYHIYIHLHIQMCTE